MSSVPRNSTLSGNTGPPQQQTPQKIGDYYMYETIGKGSFGKVKRGTHIPTGERVAIKILNRQKLKTANMDKKIRREINILKLFRHPNICRLYEVLQTQDDIFLIMEHIDGGELYDYIVKQGQLKEDAARYVFQQIVCAIEYCHHFRVVHRDLKPENILLGQNLQVKIIDFGLSNLMRDGDFLATSCGSPNYAAPEVISGKLYCGPEVDVWSAGVVLYALLCGCLPFDEDSIPQLFAKIKKGKYDVPSHVTSGARGLLAQLLTVDPLHRATIPQVRDNAWFNHRLPTHLVFNEVLYHEGDRIHQNIIRSVAELFRLGPKDLQQVRSDVTNKRGSAYVAYCILIDAQRRRELNNYGSTVANDNGQQQQQSQGVNGSTPLSSPLQASRRTAAQRELNLGLVLSINPAIEALLDGGDATSNKDLYNNGTFLPVSNRSITSIGTPHGSHLSSSLAGGGMGGVGGGTAGNGSDNFLGSGFSLTRKAQLSTPVGGNVGSLMGGGMGESGSLRNPSTLSRFSPQARPANDPTLNSARVGSVARTTLVYNAAEAEVAFASNAGWRVGIMTNKASNAVMEELYDLLAGLDMCWKVLSPYRVAAKFNHPPKTAKGAARQRQLQEATQRNLKAMQDSTNNFTNEQQQQNAESALSSSFAGLGNTMVGAAVTARPLVLTIHLFRLQEKHDKGYIVDFGVRGGEQPMVAMDLIGEIYESLRRRIA